MKNISLDLKIQLLEIANSRSFDFDSLVSNYKSLLQLLTDNVQ